MNPNTYRTIMIGHTLAKLYGAVMEAELSNHTETLNLRAPEQIGFRRAFSTIVHIFTFRYLIDQKKAPFHIIYVRECLAPFLTLIFNRALTEGFPPLWTMNTMPPIHKWGDPIVTPLKILR